MSKINVENPSQLIGSVPSAEADCSDSSYYEEIIIEEEDEEFIEEIIGSESDEEIYTDITYDSGDDCDTSFVFNGPESGPLEDILNTPKKKGSKRGVAQSSASIKSKSSRSSTSIRGMRRPKIKSAAQKAMEEEARRKVKQEKLARYNRKKILARQREFKRKEEERRLAREVKAAERAKLEIKRAQRRREREQQVTLIAAQQAATQISREKVKNRKQLELEIEDLKRQVQEEAKRKALEDRAAMQHKEEERARKEDALVEKRRMEDEVRFAEQALREATIAKKEAQRKEAIEKGKTRSMLRMRRQKSRRQKSLEKKKALADQKKITEAKQSTSTPTTPQAQQFYSVDELRNMSVPGLDYKNREIYLSDEDCVALFKVPRDEFLSYPKWKITTAKRKVKLF